MKLSIIIPVYNVEAYLTKCLDSCVKQTADKSEYELIIINDGATDNSSAIIDSYCWNGCNHLVVNQKNQGLSMARNNGVQRAQGDYIWFVDSDDWISENAVKQILQSIDSNNKDLICLRSFYKSYPEEDVLYTKKGKYSSGIQILSHPFDVMAVLYIYKKSFLHQHELTFKAGIYNEDTEFTPRALYFVKESACIHEPLYYYRQREGSIMTTVNPKRITDLITISTNLFMFKDNILNPDYKKKWGRYILTGPILEMLWLIHQIKDKELEQKVKEYVNRNCIVNEFISSPYFQIKVLGIMAKILRNKLYCSYNLLYKLRY